MAGSVGSEDGDIGFQMAPIVEVVLVLMLFFMASAGAQGIEKELSINLPSSTSESKSDTPILPIIVAIAADGTVQINGTTYDSPESRDLPQTRDQLKSMLEFGNQNPVIITPAPEARQEYIVRVLNAAAAAGVKKLTFS